jgi:uncharacterized repeat protein (TIGR03803 family)
MDPMIKSGRVKGNYFGLNNWLAGARWAGMAVLGLAIAGVPARGQNSKSAKETTLYTFSGGTDGASPSGGVIRDAEGNLYGTTFAGGAHSLGTVFKVDSKGKETVLYSFSGPPDGQGPDASLLRDSNGNLFGTNYEGGANKYGDVFEIDSSGNESVIYSFGPGTDGEYPGSGLIQDSEGNLYGTTGYGGASGNGTVFKVTLSGQATILHSFTGKDGQYPFCSLLRDSAGNMYGTTSAGGTYGDGTVFKLSKNGKVKVLHTFGGGSTDGATPYAGLIQDKAGNFYGATSAGGGGCDGYDCGTVFKLTPKNKETMLHAFGLSDGHYPQFGNLIEVNSNLYGTTYAGGADDAGVVYEVNSNTGKESIVYSFTDGKDEGYPQAGLVMDKAGNFYSTTNGNDSSTWGTVFKLKP